MELKTFTPGDHNDLPTRSELHCLKPGLFVKLQSVTGEYFWARVTSNRRDNRTWTAAVETKCITDPDFGHGALVVFGSENVAAII
ncbi:MAG: hypothetical protein C4519_18825 [Desulfobacteraceae bacterium]|nr:MAG: hypothetical protein C4519_18825 [Desulfobacteraceae bacterium]